MKKINKISNTLKGAWLITWEFYSPNKRENLERIGIDDEIVDILDSHKNFEGVLKYTKDIYKLLRGSYSDKVLLAKRGKKRMMEKEFFNLHSLNTHYKTRLYSKLIKTLEEKGIDSRKHKEISEKWTNYPQYIRIGHNPGIYTRKVRDVKVYINNNDQEWIEWKEPLMNGCWKIKKYKK